MSGIKVAGAGLSVEQQCVGETRLAAMQIHVIGLGVAERATLDDRARAALEQADVVMGSRRQHEVVAEILEVSAESSGVLSASEFTYEPSAKPVCVELPDFKNLLATLEQMALDGVKTLAVLASGDPLFYGIGRWFVQQFSRQCVHFYPAVSSVQAACHALGLSLQDVTVVSLHGRPLASIRRHLKRHKTLVILTDAQSTPTILARECIAAGFEHSTITVCEALGYRRQAVTRLGVSELASGAGEKTIFDPLHISVIELSGAGGVLPEFPGIADEAYHTDAGEGRGMLTKRDVRLSILSRLQPAADDVIWDVGAGCGGVSVELAHWNERVQVVAIEHHEQRFECLKANRQKFGVVSNLTPVHGRAPAVLADLPRPNKVFIGGSDGEMAGLLDCVWSRLPAAGVLVASAVTETSRQQLLSFMQARQSQADTLLAETSQVAISSGATLAGQLLYRPNLPVTLFHWIKQVDA